VGARLIDIPVEPTAGTDFLSCRLPDRSSAQLGIHGDRVTNGSPNWSLRHDEVKYKDIDVCNLAD
jgi:hypothetical protein